MHTNCNKSGYVYYTLSWNLFYKLTSLIFLSFSVSSCYAQVLNDGPLKLIVKLKSVYAGFNETDATVLGSGFAPDEIKFKVWATDSANISGLGWQGGKQYEYYMGTGTNNILPGSTPYVGDTLFYYDYTNPDVPEFFSLKLEAWEDDLPSDSLLGFCLAGDSLSFDTARCCGNLIFGVCVGLQEGDDKYCNTPFFSGKVPYRSGPPRTWFNLEDISGTCGNNWKVAVEIYWDSPNVSSVEEYDSYIQVYAYPNPTLVNWNLMVKAEQLGSLAEVFDIMGRCVYRKEITQPQSEISFPSSKGVYMLHLIQNGKAVQRLKLIHW